MPARVAEFVRSHPVRTVAYALALVAAAWIGLTARGILRGERNALLTRAAHWQWPRKFVERNFKASYSVGTASLTRDCGGYRVTLTGAAGELMGVAQGGASSVSVCLPLNGQAVTGRAAGVSFGDGAGEEITVGSVEGAASRIAADSVAWSDLKGELARVAAVQASIGARNGSIRNLRMLDSLVTVDSASAALARTPPAVIEVKSADVRGVTVAGNALLLAPAAQRLQASANALAAMGQNALSFPSVASETARGLVWTGLWIVAAALLALKILSTLTLEPLLLRVAAILAPFAAAGLLALTHSWLAIAIAAPAVAIALVLTAYRRAEWFRTLEPAAVDVPVVLVGLVLMGLLSWPQVKTPQTPSITQVSLAQAGIHGVTVNVAPGQCANSGPTAVTVPEAGVAGLKLALAGGSLTSIDIDRVTANGRVQAQALPDLQRVEYLPREWKSTAPITFCASVALRNSGFAPLPAANCAADLVARASVDYTGESARFAADWTGPPETVSATGSASVAGAQVESVRTAPGAAVRVGNATARVTWKDSIAVAAMVRNVEAAGAMIDDITLDAHAPGLCKTGPLLVSVRAGNATYSSARLAGATLEFARPDATRITASGHLGAVTVTGAVEASLPGADFHVTGTTSRETIPQRLDAQTSFTTEPVRIAAPVRFSADLWTGSLQVPRQSIAVTQLVTSRAPRDIALDLQASANLLSVASPVQANAQARLNIGSLVPDIGPTELTLSDLSIDAAWDSGASAAPVRIASGWNTLRTAGFPSSATLIGISSLHVETRGTMSEPLALEVPSIQVPAIPTPLKFRIEGTRQSIRVIPETGEPITLDGIQTRILKASLPGLKLESVETETEAEAHRAGAAFGVAVHSTLTDVDSTTALTAPLAATIHTTPASVDFVLNAPLDTAKVLRETGLKIDGLDLRTTLTDLGAHVRFDGGKVAGLDVTGTLAPGPLASGKGFELSQERAARFHFAAPRMPGAQVDFAVDGLTASFNGGKQNIQASAQGAVDLALSPAPESPLLKQLVDAASGIGKHITQARDIFGVENASGYPVTWDVEVRGKTPTVSFGADRLAANLAANVKRLDIGAYTFDGNVDLAATARVENDHLWMDVRAPGEIGALGRRFRLEAPLVVALRPELLPAKGEGLFDCAFYQCAVNDNRIHLGIGYGDALQVVASLHQPFFYGLSDAAVQSAIRWRTGAASIASFGAFSFRGLEAGAIALPRPFLEDRLNGDIRFSTSEFPADRMLVPRLMNDAASLPGLEDVSFSARVWSDRPAPLLGMSQTESRVTLKPANELLRSIIEQLQLKFPPTHMSYDSLTADLRVEKGVFQTEAPLVKLTGVQVQGLAGLDTNLNIRWPGRSRGPAPKLRDVIYAAQKALAP